MENVVKECDAVENDLLPEISLATTTASFGEISFGQTKVITIPVVNTGNTAVVFNFRNRLLGQTSQQTARELSHHVAAPWIRVSPISGMVHVGETVNVRITLSVTRFTAKFGPQQTLPADGNLGDVTVLHTHGLASASGRNYFLTISGQLLAGCFGHALSELVRRPFPIRGAGTDPSAPASAPSVEHGGGRAVGGGGIPEELQLLIGWLDQRAPAAEQASLFLEPGDARAADGVRELLEVAGSLEAFRGDPRAVADCLAQMVDSLGAPVVPARLHRAAFDAAVAGDVGTVLALPKRLPAVRPARGRLWTLSISRSQLGCQAFYGRSAAERPMFDGFRPG